MTHLFLTNAGSGIVSSVQLLTSYGYILRDKLHSESFNKLGRFSSSYNQTWVKI
jgi:hypothetical protein